MKYLKGTSHLGLVYQRPEDLAKAPAVEIYVDASFAPNLALNKGKSIIGYVVKLWNQTIAWAVHRTRRVALSSAEAECCGLVEANKENRWLRSFIDYIGIIKVDGPTQIWEDNSASIQLSGSRVYHRRSKYFALEWYAVKESVDLKEIHISYVKSEDQIADLFTKSSLRRQHLRFRDSMIGSLDSQRHFDNMDQRKNDDVTYTHFVYTRTQVLGEGQHSFGGVRAAYFLRHRKGKRTSQGH